MRAVNELEKLNSLIPVVWDTVSDAVYDGNDNLTSIKFYFEGTLVSTITITYDGSNRFYSAART